MAVNPFRIYLGPVGNLQALPPMEKDSLPDVSAVLVGASHLALSGRTTIDVFGYKRQWKLRFPYRTEDDLVVLQAAYRRTSVGAFGSLRLFDARRRNCLGVTQSTGGSEKQSTLGFTGVGGTLTWGAVVGLPSPVSSACLGAVTFVSTAANQTVLTSGLTVPVLAGSGYRYSSYTSGSGAWTPIIQPYDVNGNALSIVGGASTPQFPSPTWVRSSVGQYFPSSNVASFAVGWQSSAANTLSLTGMQVEVDSSSPSVQPWVLGVGCPTVYVASLQEQYFLLNENVNAVIQEV